MPKNVFSNIAQELLRRKTKLIKAMINKDGNGLTPCNQEWSKFLGLTDTRPDWHEPDEQHLSVIVTGFNFDNAMGDRRDLHSDVYVDHPESEELRLHIKQEDVSKIVCSLNMATLCSLAMVGLMQLVKDVQDQVE